MRILISNDDGVQATGLAVLANALKDLGEILVVAPDRDRSGASNSLTLSRPLLPQQLQNGFWSVDGTPTDCVHLAVGGVFNFQPDLVVSGINNGPNLGDDVLYSGTVAAATEGRFQGLPAIAVSLAGTTHFATAAAVIHRLVKAYIEDAASLKLPPRSLLNVNVPDVPLFVLQGYAVTSLGHRNQGTAPVKITDPRGATRYWIGGLGTAADTSPGTDFDALSRNQVSITPLQLDMTNHSSLESLHQWLPL